jgi:hypothetical protein
MVVRRTVLLQGAIFVIAVFTILLFAGEATRFLLGRVLFAISVSSVCLIAELYVAVRIGRFLWRLSGRMASSRPYEELSTSGGRNFDGPKELAHIDNARGEQ